MAFESLTDRLAGVFKKLRGHGKLSEADIKAAMREVRMALLEADVNKLLKQFEMMQKMMKQFKKSPKGFARKLGGLMGSPGAFRGMK